MLTLICAPSGYGKTHHLYDRISEKLADGTNSRMFVIVPEQESVKSEKALLERFGNSLNDRVEILNFSRLANRVFREAGGITYKYVDNGGKDLIVSTILEDCIEEFPYFSQGLDDENFISSLRSELDNLRIGGVDADGLLALTNDISKKEVNSERLVEKIKNLATVYSLYEGAVLHGNVDSVDDLRRLSQTLDEYDFFYNTTVFIDGFYDFTYPEYEVIRRMMSGCEDVYLTLPTIENDNENIFSRATLAKEKIIDICEEISCEYNVVMLDIRVKKQAEALTCLAERIIDGRAVEARLDANDAITLVSCKTPFDECVYTAREIVRLVKNGVKFSDIAVCSNNVADYGTMLEDIFEKYGIRFLKSNHDTLMSKPLVSFIFSALDVVVSGFYLPVVKRYLESPLLSIDKKYRFLLSNYITAWNINKSLWYSESDWVMNPRGYVGELTESDKHELEAVNRARRKIAVPLLRLAEGMKKEKVSEKVAAVWSFLNDVGVKTTLISRADKFLEKADYVRSRDEATAWNLTLSSLDRITSTLGDRSTTTERFVKYMRIVFRESTFGRIPSNLDEVEVGDIGFARNDNIKHLFLLGFNEGLFPSNKSPGGVFSENERHVLEQFSEFFKADSQERLLQNELFNLLVAVSAPTDALHLTYHTSSSGSSDDRVSFFASMISSYVNVDLETFDSQNAFPVCREELADWIMMHHDSDNIDALISAVRENAPDFADEVSARINARRFSSEELTFTLPENVYKKDISMSQSRLDTYSRCPFSFYSNYLLSLRTHKKIEFRAAETGSLVHRVLEDVLARIVSDGKRLQDVEKEEVERLALESAENYLKTTAHEISESSKRFRYLVKRLTSFVLYVIENMREEFENSDFSPIYFEKRMAEDSEIHPYSIELPDGGSLVFNGCVDRVDIYEDDNGKKYLRVVDYKTKIGGKKFDLNDVINGINLQLLVYLFAIWQDGEKSDSSPAGIMYMPASRPLVMLESVDKIDSEKETRDSEMKRSGLFLYDEKILEAMEHGLEGRVLPIKRNKNGTFSSQSALATLEQFGALKRYTDKVFINLATKLRSGDIGASPLCSGTLDACKWCDFKPFCRYEGVGREYIKFDKPWEEIDSE